MSEQQRVLACQVSNGEKRAKSVKTPILDCSAKHGGEVAGVGMPRCVDKYRRIHCSFIIGKVRVVTAAVLAVKLD